MHKLILIITTLGTLVVAAPALASSHKCKPISPVLLSVRAINISCKTAAAVERRAGPLDVAFYAGRRQWLGAVYSRAHGHTYFVFVSPGNPIVSVWITNRGTVS